ncbi:PEGA domain-containing protein [Patescibacteria group bacterium]|nr:PEGA domain-containing protein [Patescibacteria group bacterium]
MIKRLLSSIGIILFILLIAGSIIAYSRGYRFNLQDKELTPTGILSATSYPEGASIWLNDKLTSATNVSISLLPGWYNLRIGKEGYQSWEKQIRIQGEVVTRADALLIPTNPSLRALTITGVTDPTLSSTGGRVAYLVTTDEASYSASLKPKTGVWVMDLKSGPLGGQSEPKQIYTANGSEIWKDASIIWSPDEKQIILKFSKTEEKMETVYSAYQIYVDNPNILPTDVTSSWETLVTDWQETQKLKDNAAIDSLPPLVATFLHTAASDIRFSPDDTKILYEATSSATLAQVIVPPLIGTNTTQESRSIVPGKYYIYDTKEDKNFFIVDTKSINSPQAITWYTDSKHIILIEKGSIYIVDYDGSNIRTVYTGPFEGDIVFPWASSDKLVILTNFYKPQSIPNLYEIDLR